MASSVADVICRLLVVDYMFLCFWTVFHFKFRSTKVMYQKCHQDPSTAAGRNHQDLSGLPGSDD